MPTHEPMTLEHEEQARISTACEHAAYLSRLFPFFWGSLDWVGCHTCWPLKLHAAMD